MPIKVENCITAHVFIHDGTWDYICRNCLARGKDVKMITYEDYSGVWIKCPECGVRERIDLNDLWKSLMFFKNFFHLEK